MTPPQTLDDPHNIRLFPRGAGADAYRITGIAARCDWVVLSDGKAPRIHLHRNDATPAPRHIFLSLRDPFHALTEFATRILPDLKQPFVLVSGSEDVTLPRQCDQRWRGYTAIEQGHIQAILDHPHLIRWFAENLSDGADPRFASLPTGMVFRDGPPDTGVPVGPSVPLRDRPLRILVGHRVRPGPQWDLRRQISDRARSDWGGVCTVLDTEVPEAEFLSLMQSHAFVLCAEGGGFDPSPKAWQTMLHGSIPIIRATATGRAYTQLPVAFVDTWHECDLSTERLARWRDTFAPVQDAPASRTELMNRLGLAYWWDQIAAQARS
ncbi:hypothetical protein [Puniceibacterium sp. IMCC21224]|uniref:hypothetical protein n=1 Tax=Puniceibacterium sp. IMCC21224 TaxID=1618204 RepID=UPI00064DB6ED|nr:hypothetical protein [Puniceibacterium sp. IMCC21224]KMK64016.1 hypothetical protein IMCC21224_1674 [Puniceibacterium sp. IMCC21224]